MDNEEGKRGEERHIKYTIQYIHNVPSLELTTFILSLKLPTDRFTHQWLWKSRTWSTQWPFTTHASQMIPQESGVQKHPKIVLTIDEGFPCNSHSHYQHNNRDVSRNPMYYFNAYRKRYHRSYTHPNTITRNCQKMMISCNEIDENVCESCVLTSMDSKFDLLHVSNLSVHAAIYSSIILLTSFARVGRAKH